MPGWIKQIKAFFYQLITYPRINRGCCAFIKSILAIKTYRPIFNPDMNNDCMA